MPSAKHEDKLTEIDRIVKAKSNSWNTKKQFPIVLPSDGRIGYIDIVAFRPKIMDETNTKVLAKPVIAGWEVEESGEKNPQQVKRNYEKLEHFKKSFSKDEVDVYSCQLSSKDHLNLCGPMDNISVSEAVLRKNCCTKRRMHPKLPLQKFKV